MGDSYDFDIFIELKLILGNVSIMFNYLKFKILWLV